MPHTTLKFALTLCCALALSPAASASTAPAPSDGTCSIHIWRRGIYKSESAANLAAFGIVGAVLQDQYDRKYPAASMAGVIEDVLNITALPATLAAVPWQTYTGAAHNDVVYEREAITEARFKELKTSTTRNSTAPNACYIELYIGAQTFSGGSIKSHLFSDFHARTFSGAVLDQKSAILWDQTPHLSVKDAASLAEAKHIIANGFVATLTKFLANKLPRPKAS